MAKEFSKSFYESPHWRKTRANYFEYCHGYCELCMQEGIFSRAEIIHHKIELTPENITNPNISLSFENLQALCRECHLKVHGNRHKRFKIDELGRVSAR